MCSSAFSFKGKWFSKWFDKNVKAENSDANPNGYYIRIIEINRNIYDNFFIAKSQELQELPLFGGKVKRINKKLIKIKTPPKRGVFFFENLLLLVSKVLFSE